MNKPEIIDIISEKYYPLSSECKLEFSNDSQILRPNRNSILVKEGEYTDKIFFIVKGCARAYYYRDGKDVSDWFAFENDFVSAINSFFLNIPSPHFIEVLESSVLLQLSKINTEKLSNKYPDFERLSKIIITKTMLQLQERIASIQFQSAKQRYENILLTHPHIIQRIPLTHIASYLGITLETLSRIRKPDYRI